METQSRDTHTGEALAPSGVCLLRGCGLHSPDPTPHATGWSKEASATVLGPQSSDWERTGVCKGRRRERALRRGARAGGTAVKSGWSRFACVWSTRVCMGTGTCVRKQIMHVGVYVTARVRVHVCTLLLLLSSGSTQQQVLWRQGAHLCHTRSHSMKWAT